MRRMLQLQSRPRLRKGIAKKQLHPHPAVAVLQVVPMLSDVTGLLIGYGGRQ